MRRARASDVDYVAEVLDLNQRTRVERGKRFTSFCSFRIGRVCTLQVSGN